MAFIKMKILIYFCYLVLYFCFVHKLIKLITVDDYLEFNPKGILRSIIPIRRIGQEDIKAPGKLCIYILKMCFKNFWWYENPPVKIL